MPTLLSAKKVLKDDSGKVTELRCTYLPETLGGKPPSDGHKVKGIIHWVSVSQSLPVQVRLYDRLFKTETPGDDFLGDLNPHSLTVMQNARAEKTLESSKPGSRFQFERLGYFYSDPELCTADQLVFNRIVTLKDTWSKS